MDERELKLRFGALLTAIRRRRGLTQPELAARADLSKDMVARMETGASGARFPTIVKLATALEVDPAELFTAEIPKSVLRRPKLSAMNVRLSKLSDEELEWLNGVLDSVLTRRP